MDVRVQSCYSVVGPHTSKEQVSAHARRGRVEVKVVRRLEGESAIEVFTMYPGFKAP